MNSCKLSPSAFTVKILRANCCSGWLPFAKEYPGALGEGAKAGTPVLQCHGDADVVVQHAWGAQSHAALKGMGITAEFETYR